MLQLKEKCTNVGYCIKNDVPVPASHHLSSIGCTGKSHLLSWNLIISCGHTTEFYLGKVDLLTVYLGKLNFLSVTDFSLGNLPRGNFIVWGLDMSREQ